ncbi:hypothetical protein [Pseudomonas sp. N040]|uniref:hypothetical protein n=1 Tax=Pseudomonas sp. N040 TaxID=2785325 RepID=UPI0018A2D0BD|nr:hypothetical protein [Pseudomonas sp. N040]MBF7728585.1 hypothetical protein [Pseudomonas sp. N040]MBW7012225.1 hypothetical protein [Pseudomonas sp. N040]
MKLIKSNNVISLDTSIEQREHQYLKHLTSALSHYLENPQGSELICVLGSGYEKNNRQALETWVFYHRDEVFQQRLDGRNPLNYLIEKLEDLLRN